MDDNYKDAREAINSMADVKMTMNRHKGKIEDVYSGDLVKMMNDEINELVAAMDSNNLMHVIEEAADVQNFLIAIVHQKIAEYRRRKNANTN